MKGKCNFSGLWLVIIVLMVFIVIYAVTQWKDESFVDDLFSNSAATMLGSILGVFIALWLSTKEQERQEQKEKKARAQETEARKLKILGAIKTELAYNLEQLQANKNQEERTRQVYTAGYKNELWNAFSDGGELEWIRDPELLGTISWAYFHINRMILLETLYLQNEYYPGITPDYTPDFSVTPQHKLIDQLVSLDPLTAKSIGNALKTIDTNLSQIK